MATDFYTTLITVILGQSSNTSRDLRIDTQGISIDSRDLRTTGETSQNIANDIRIIGEVSTQVGHDLRIIGTGTNTSSVDSNIRISGRSVFIARPDGDISTNEWTPVGDTSLAATINEGTNYSSEVVSDLPAAWWRLEEATGSFIDSSGNAHTAIPSGSPIYRESGVEGIPNYSVQFTGDDYAKYTRFNLTDGLKVTLEAWIKLSATTGIHTIHEMGHGKYATRVNGPTGEVELWHSNVVRMAWSTIAVNDGKWHHVVCLKDGAGATCKIYVDGQDVTAPGQVVSTPGNNSNHHGFGARWIASEPIAGTFFIGYIDEPAVYDGVLAPSRIKAHYNVIALDSDYMLSPAEPGTPKDAEVSLQDVTAPLIDDYHVVRYRIAGKTSPAAVQLTVILLQGSTTIASWNHQNLSSSPTTYEQVLTNPQAASITDYTDLRLRFRVEAA